MHDACMYVCICRMQQAPTWHCTAPVYLFTVQSGTVHTPSGSMKIKRESGRFCSTWADVSDIVGI